MAVLPLFDDLAVEQRPTAAAAKVAVATDTAAAVVAVAVTAKVAAASRVTMSQPYLVFPLFIAFCQVGEKT